MGSGRAILAGLTMLAVIAPCGGCRGGASSPGESVDSTAPGGPDWALAIHGGAGSIPDDEDHETALRESLGTALDLGRRMLADGRPAVDVVERVVRLMEDDPLFNAGRGAVFNREGRHELDASIMDGRDRSCGAVAAVTSIRNPIGLAREVMRAGEHVLLCAAGAERFADELGVERVTQGYFSTERRRKSLRRFLERTREPAAAHGTVGAVALDREGNLAAATSTGGLTGKRPGRIGDTPIPGAGTYADNGTCGVSGTGRGEEYIRHAVGHSISAMMRHGGFSLERAARTVVHETLRPGDGGIIAVGQGGEIVMEFNTPGMLRAAADSTGMLDVRTGS